MGTDDFSKRPAAEGAFASTHWSEIFRARDSQLPASAAAMEQLCRTYWYPLYSFVRRRGYGHEDACDLTQSFFVRLLEKRSLSQVDASRGKFRTFLLASLGHFLANEWDRSRTQRRGGGVALLSLDSDAAAEQYGLEPVDHLTPEKIFERRWAEALMSSVLERLASEVEGQRFEVLKGFLTEDKRHLSYEVAAAQLGMSTGAITSAIHRLRARFRELLYEEVAKTVETLDQIEPELRHLMSTLHE